MIAISMRSKKQTSKNLLVSSFPNFFRRMAVPSFSGEHIDDDRALALPFFETLRSFAEGLFYLRNGECMDAEGGDVDRLVHEQVDRRAIICAVVGNGGEGQPLFLGDVQLCLHVREGEAGEHDPPAVGGHFERDLGGNAAKAAVHARGGHPAARDAHEVLLEGFVRLQRIVDAALRRDGELFLALVDEHGHRLAVDELLGEDVSERPRAEHGDVRALRRVQLVDHRLAGGYDADEQRLLVGDGGGQRGEVRLFRHDKIAQESLSVHAGGAGVRAALGVAGHAVLAAAAGQGIVEVDARVLFDRRAACPRLPDDAHGEHAGHEGVLRVQRAAVVAQVCIRKEQLRHFDLCLRLAGHGVRPLFRGENFGRKYFPDLHCNLKKMVRLRFFAEDPTLL